MVRELWESLSSNPLETAFLLGGMWCLIGDAPATAFLMVVLAVTLLTRDAVENPP